MSLDHNHDFGQSQRRKSETKTLSLVLLTFSTMVLEIGADWHCGLFDYRR
jgi:hypothetical protein